MTMKSGNRDKAEGAVKEVKGKVKQGVGRVIDDPDMEAEGQADQVEGRVQNKKGDVKKVFNQ